MAQFLIDVNLPYYFGLWNNDSYIHQRDILRTASDKAIWEYAKANNLTIISKDVDFSQRILFSHPPKSHPYYFWEHFYERLFFINTQLLG